jgi:hypothetical protein
MRRGEPTSDRVNASAQGDIKQGKELHAQNEYMAYEANEKKNYVGNKWAIIQVSIH